MTSYDEEMNCPECDSTGWVWNGYATALDDSDIEKIDCDNCGATGKVSVMVWSSEDQMNEREVALT